MRVSCIPNYGTQNYLSKYYCVKKNIENPVPKPIQNENPSFKGCDFFKVAGFLVGAAAVVVFAPAAAAVGLAGLGAGPGALLGAAIDEKIDESKDKDK